MSTQGERMQRLLESSNRILPRQKSQDASDYTRDKMVQGFKSSVSVVSSQVYLKKQNGIGSSAAQRENPCCNLVVNNLTQANHAPLPSLCKKRDLSSMQDSSIDLATDPSIKGGLKPLSVLPKEPGWGVPKNSSCC